MNASRPSQRRNFPNRQRGIITAMAAVVLIAAVIYVLIQSFGIIGTTSSSNQSQSDSIAAFFLAESGVEQGKGILSAASGPNSSTVCASLFLSGVSPTGSRGSFSRLSGVSAPSGCLNNCTSCTITSTGTVGSASRTVEVVMSVTAPSGGATGYGGGCQVQPTPIPNPCPTPPDGNPAHQDIVQNIEVKEPPSVSAVNPVVLLSNMAYLRHPAGGVTVEAAGCVTIPGGGLCTANWNDQSSSSSGDVVVGSRGVTAKVTAAGSYELRQNLTEHSMYAAVGAKIGGTDVKVIGSYWDDNGPDGTYANSQALTGETNNGAATDPSLYPPDVADPPPIINAGTRQTKTSWCYGADTLMLGFSGRSSNNATGRLDSFKFGSAPVVGLSLTPLGGQVPSGMAEYPAHTATTDSKLYSTVYYVHNPNYLSKPDAISGAVVTGSAGATFTATLTGGNATMVVAIGGVTSGRLSVGDTVSGSSRLGGPGNTSKIATAPSSGLDGNYTLEHVSSGPPSTTASLSATSSVLYVSAALSNLGNLAESDTIYGTGVTANTTIMVLGNPLAACTAGAGGIGCYTLSPAQRFGSTTITSNGMTVNTPSSITAPTVGTYVAKRWTGSGTGVLPAETTVVGNPTPSPTSFKLSTRPLTPLSGAQVCGGICAFFDHSSASAVTTFTITIPSTQQWAAGMTCLSGVDTSSITGLIGEGIVVKATNWRELVR